MHHDQLEYMTFAAILLAVILAFSLVELVARKLKKNKGTTLYIIEDDQRFIN